jgi:hypothetical protein
MLSYPIGEAEELLASKLSAAKQSLENCEEDLDFLREQITVRFFRMRHQAGGQFPRTVTNSLSDYGGGYSKSVQLGCHYETQREERARSNRRKRESWNTEWLKRANVSKREIRNKNSIKDTQYYSHSHRPVKICYLSEALQCP